MSRVSIIVLMAAMAACACSAWQVDLWPSHNGNAEFASVAPVAVNDALVLWPYVGGPVYAVNTTTKKLLWGDTFESVSLLLAVPASNVVLVGTSNFVFAYHVPTGKLLWANDTIATMSQMNPLVIGDTVVFNSNTGYNTVYGIVAFSAATGDFLYTAFPSITNGQAVVALSATVGAFGGSASFTAFELATGKQLWQVLGNPSYSMGFVAAGEGFLAVSNTTSAPAAFASIDREVLVLNATTGAVEFRLHAMAGASSYNRYARIYKGHLYALVDEEELQVYSLTTGYMEWALPLGYSDYSYSMFAYSGDRMVMASQVNYYYNPPTYSIVNALTGKQIKSMTNSLASGSTTTFTINGDVLVIPNSQGFAAYSLADGSALFQNSGTTGVNPASLMFLNGGLTWSNGTAVFGQPISS